MKTNRFSSQGERSILPRRITAFVRFLGSIFGCLLVLMLSRERAMARRAPWKLLDYHQKGCVNISSPYSDRAVYFGIWLDGRWIHQLQVELRHAPAGSTSQAAGLPIGPGSSEGVYALGYVAVQVAPDTPIGSYTFELWVSDGATRQRMPVKLVVAETCNGY